MSAQQEQLIVELGNSLQWLPTSARVVAWCRLVSFMESLPEGELADPILALLPYIGDVASRDFASYHETLVKVVRQVPEKERGRVLVGLRDVAAKLPLAMRPLLSGNTGTTRAPTGLAAAPGQTGPASPPARGRPGASPDAAAAGPPPGPAARPGAPGGTPAPAGPPRGLSPRLPGRV